jgi:predicted kinase
MAKLKLYILAGMPGSGKSTTAVRLRETGVIIVSSDEVRLDLNNGKYPSGDRYKELEHKVWLKVENTLVSCFLEGINCGIDATNLTINSRSKWITLSKNYNPNYEIHILWHEGKFDSFERWNMERGTKLEDYESIISRLKSTIELPNKNESDVLQILNGDHIRSKI